MATAFISGYTPTDKSKFRRSSGLTQVLSSSGTLRYIDLGPETRWNLDLHFGPMTEAERITLEDWLITNEKVEISIDVGTATYVGYIDANSGIALKPSQGGFMWEVSFGFFGTKQ